MNLPTHYPTIYMLRNKLVYIFYIPLFIFGMSLWLTTLTALAQESSAPPELFVDVSNMVGIDAVHAGSWDQYHKYREFTDGYLASGQAWGDYNNDGWIDLYVTGGLTTSVLYQNNGEDAVGNVSFSVAATSKDVALPDTFTGGAVWADYDNDGWKDLYVLAHGANQLFHNDAGVGFTNVTESAGVGDERKGSTAAWGDYDGDSFLDLYIANWSCFPLCDPVDHGAAQDRFYHNNGDGTFTDISDLLNYEKLLGAGFSVSFIDFDNDRDLDIYVVNDKLHNPIGNVLWRNDGKDGDGDCGGWCWTDVSAETGADVALHGMGLAVGDYDNDQDLDLHFTNMIDPNGLLENQDGLSFSDRIMSSGLPNGPTRAVSWGTSFFDYDNDGWLDLYYATTAFIKFNDMEGPLGLMLPFPNFLYNNRGPDTSGRVRFKDVTPASWVDTPIPSMGFAYADYDRDGRVDFVQANWKERYRLYRNQTEAAHHWLTIRLIGAGPINRDAVGTRIYLTLTDGRKLMQEVKSGSALGSGNDTALHFGLGSAKVSSAVVVWPNGLKRLYPIAPVDQIWHLIYPGYEDDPLLARLRAAADKPFEDVSQAAGITAKHRASWKMFKPEFTMGYLGIGQAWGDYDGDGWVDLYVTGNLEPNVLYRNKGDGTFSESKFSGKLALTEMRSGGAVWTDYDNDGKKDLYVLNHGANTLFRNTGSGFLDVTSTAGVGDTGKGSTATWGDYDSDGKLDLYVTNWSCYPECDPIDERLAQDRLYHNNGDGTFEDVSNLLGFEKLLGAGFTASFGDFDGDQDADIYVVNDALWNPIGNVLWRNDGPDEDGTCGGWCWTDASTETGAGVVIEGMGLAVGDYDNDLDLDLYFSNMVNPNALMQNTGNGFFRERAKKAGVDTINGPTVGWGTSFLDYDNDGWLDLFMSTTSFRNIDPDTPPDGMHFGHPNLLYHNEGDGTFSNKTPANWYEIPRRSMGVATADYDQDGAVDFITGDWDSGYRLYRNKTANRLDNQWISLRLTGGGNVNRDAIGARVYITTDDGQIRMQEVKSGSSLGAGNDTALHFGLGDSSVTWVMVHWPDGRVQFVDGIRMNRLSEIAY